jgi:hypothetical protein
VTTVESRTSNDSAWVDGTLLITEDASELVRPSMPLGWLSGVWEAGTYGFSNSDASVGKVATDGAGTAGELALIELGALFFLGVPSSEPKGLFKRLKFMVDRYPNTIKSCEYLLFVQHQETYVYATDRFRAKAMS